MCRFVLKLKALQNALRRPPPEKPKHTPKRYRNEILGECYLRHTDVHTGTKNNRYPHLGAHEQTSLVFNFLYELADMSFDKP